MTIRLDAPRRGNTCLFSKRPHSPGGGSDQEDELKAISIFSNSKPSPPEGACEFVDLYLLGLSQHVCNMYCTCYLLFCCIVCVGVILRLV